MEREFGARSERRADGTTVVAIVGELELHTSPELERALKLNGSTNGQVVVDLSECSFIDSSGLGALARAARRIGPHALVIVATGQEVLRALEVSRLDRVFVVCPSFDSALNGAS